MERPASLQCCGGGRTEGTAAEGRRITVLGGSSGSGGSVGSVGSSSSSTVSRADCVVLPSAGVSAAG